MKHILPLSLLVTSLSLHSCYQGADEALNVRQTSVTFNINAEGVEQQALTRAFSSPANLLVIDVFDGKTTVLTQESLDAIPIKLDWGSHDLYFVAANAVWSSYDKTNLTVSWGAGSKDMTGVWGKKVTMTVDAETTTTNVDLPLVVAGVQIRTLDRIPDNIGNIRVEAPDACRTLNLSDMSGTVGAGVAYAVDASPAKGNTLKHLFYTFVPATVNNIGDVSYTAYNNATTPVELATHTLGEVPVTRGYVSSYSGYFFTAGISFTFNYSDDWLGTNNYGF